MSEDMTYSMRPIGPPLPVILQYYYKVGDCLATSAGDPACVCWHDEGTGPLANESHEHPQWARDWRIRRGYRRRPSLENSS